ncbi:alanine/glycine:cation symporter family protein [Microscilla marina]|uniref:Sodium/alanine symporter n=1 Tax=Microscilla marina ATCC 23134 TaxID=313606 RepID=A1ZDP2_MICM2|nr:alanine/glycine:cation symporter family protein [Microscilla marina]EAY31781.1 sodium/alanine symporter [Microscilla marina ATCC 23134]
MKQLEALLKQFSGIVTTPLPFILIGGGLLLLLYSRFMPFKYFRHAYNILRGKYDDVNDPGDINHYEALASALAATVGVGNIGGVAVAIVTGGPGAVFWMWLSAFVGIATKFFTCTLAIMYRGKDSIGHVQGGPMYAITEGMGKHWKPLATFFCITGIFGAMPLFQANQLTEVIRNVVLAPSGLVGKDPLLANVLIGLVIVTLVSTVIFGGIQRIGKVASKMVPLMVAMYIASVLFILITHIQDVVPSLVLIVTDAFTGEAMLGGALGALIVTGVRRAAFSNEAGIGTAPMMHGAAKTKEPVREGLVAMLGPVIDTLVVCTMTALAIIVTGVWQPQIDQNKNVIVMLDAQKVTLKDNSKAIQIEVMAKVNPLKDAKPVTVSNNAKDLPVQVNATLKIEKKKTLNHIDLSAQLLNNPEGLPIKMVTYNKPNYIPLVVSQKTDAVGKAIPNQYIIKENHDLGVTITTRAFSKAMPGFGAGLLLICILVFALSTLFSYSYYGVKCTSFLLGAKRQNWYNYLYIGSIMYGAIASADAAVNLIDAMYALMAIPTMFSTIWLAPKVRDAYKDYFRRMKEE